MRQCKNVSRYLSVLCFVTVVKYFLIVSAKCDLEMNVFPYLPNYCMSV